MHDPIHSSNNTQHSPHSSSSSLKVHPPSSSSSSSASVHSGPHLQVGPSALAINSLFQRSKADTAAAIPLQVLRCLQQLKGKCLLCWLHGAESDHITSCCPGTGEWEGWQRSKLGVDDFAWKHWYFSENKSNDVKGYCWKCLLNLDWLPVHHINTTQGCLFPDMVFEIVWIILDSQPLCKALSEYVGREDVADVNGYTSWLLGRFNGEKKWRHCSTLLVLFFFNFACSHFN